MTRRIIKQDTRDIVNFSIHFSVAVVSLHFVLMLLSPLSTTLVYYLPQQAMAQASNDNTSTIPPTQRGNTLSYVHPTCQIRIQYPSNWLKDAEPASSDYVVAFVPLTDIMNATTVGIENVKIKLINSQGMTLDQYNSVVSKALSSIPNTKVIESGKTTVGRNNNPGFGVIYSVVDPSTSAEIRTMEVWTLLNNVVYDITYDASADKYSVYLPLVKTMASTLEVGTPSQQCTSQIPTVQSVAQPGVTPSTGGTTEGGIPSTGGTTEGGITNQTQ